MGQIGFLVSFLTKILNNREDAREVAQDTFALLWEHRATLSPHTSLKGYVSGIARNLALKMCRERKKGLEADQAHLWHPDTIHATDDRLVARETELILSSVLCRMPEQRRRVFEMSREEGLSLGEIARQLGISYNTVKKHLALAREDIRAALSVFLLLLLFRG